jgi:hypothetical protein
MSAAARAHQQAVQRVAVTRQARSCAAVERGADAGAAAGAGVLGVLAVPLLWLSTVAHELGHGMTALALGGRFERFVIRSDGSGTASTAAPLGDLPGALVCAGGLVGPALVAAVCFVLARRPLAARGCLAVFGRGPVRRRAHGRRPRLHAAVPRRDRRPAAARGLPAARRLGPGRAGVPRGPAGAQRVHPRRLPVHRGRPLERRRDALRRRRDAAHLGGPYWAWGLACGLISVLVLIGGLAWYLRGDSRVELHELRAR